MKSLIVDDEKVNQTLLQTFLSNYGECITADDGEEAIHEFKEALIQKVPFDLVCMDIMMPKINGQRALKEIRHIEKQYEIPSGSFVKVIMTSSLEDSNSANEAYFHGRADAYLIKPIDINLLSRELKRLNLIQ